MTTASITLDLLRGLAELLDAEGVASWDPAGGYAEGAAGITLLGMPQTPSVLLCLTDYPVSVGGRLSDMVIGVNVRIRGDREPATALALADGTLTALHGRGNTLLGTAPDQIRVNQILWQSAAPLGPDGNGRYERSTNFYVHLNRPSDRLT